MRLWNVPQASARQQKAAIVCDCTKTADVDPNRNYWGSWRDCRCNSRHLASWWLSSEAEWEASRDVTRPLLSASLHRRQEAVRPQEVKGVGRLP